MPDPVTGVIGGASVIGSVVQGRAASRAARAQTQAADAATAEQRRQFDAMRSILQPYVSAGGPALMGLMDIAGVGGMGGAMDFNAYLRDNPDVAQEASRVVRNGEFASPLEYAEWHYNNYGQREGREVPTIGGGDPMERQAAAFSAIENSPGFQALARQGEEAILQNASATGGLRGGNTQGALARFRPALLDQFIERQFGRLGGIASMGQNAAAGVGNAGLQTGANIGNLMMQAGQARAAGIGAQGQLFGQTIGGLGGVIAAGIRPGGPQASLLPSVNQAFAANPGIF